MRSKFADLSKVWTPIKKLSSTVFESKDSVKIWLERTHGGYNDGKGRKEWDAEQKARHGGYTKNSFALSILDIAEAMKFITEEQRKKRLSTVQAFIGNPNVRAALGIVGTDPKNIQTTLPDKDFFLVLEKFMKDVISETITTRKSRDKEGFKNYAADLSSISGLSNKHVDPHTVNNPAADKPPKKGSPRPSTPTKISPDDNIRRALADISNYKLENIYSSLISLTAKKHTPLLCVGVWAFLETLTTACGKKSKQSFPAYLNKQKLSDLGVPTDNQKGMIACLNRFSETGNSTKHNAISANFSERQLINDFATINDLVFRLAKEIKSKQTSTH